MIRAFLPRTNENAPAAEAIAATAAWLNTHIRQGTYSVTQKKRILLALTGSCSFVLLAYAAMHGGGTYVGNRAVYVLFPGIIVDIGISGNPHRGTGGVLSPIITFGVSIAVWFIVVWLALWVLGKLSRRFPKKDEPS